MPKSASKPLAALVFDAYGTLFDVQSVATLAETLAPGHGADLARIWRTKQLEYTWLQSLMASRRTPREDFDRITAHALDYAVSALLLPLGRAEKRRLCAGWRKLETFPEVSESLAALAPMPRWILSNGTQASLRPLVRHAGLAKAIDGVLSVDDVDVYKPSPAVYALAAKRLALPASRIGFVSSNCWDAIGARAFGFTTFWINRAGVPLDRHGPPPDFVLGSLAVLPGLVRGR